MSPSTVNLALTPERPNSRPRPSTRRTRRVVENDEYATFVRRVLAAHAKRIGRGDIEGLATLAAFAADIDAALRTAIRGLRAQGYSWADIAARLRITRQAAHQRYATADARTLTPDEIATDPEYLRHAAHSWPGDPTCPYCPTEDDIRQWEADQ